MPSISLKKLLSLRMTGLNHQASFLVGRSTDTYIKSIKNERRVDERADWIKELVIRFLSRDHIVEGENQLLQVGY